MSTPYNLPMSAGRCPRRGDGDTGTRARSAMRGLEAHSINRANTPPGGESSPIRSPPQDMRESESRTSENGPVRRRCSQALTPRGAQASAHTLHAEEGQRAQSHGYDNADDQPGQPTQLSQESITVRRETNVECPKDIEGTNESSHENIVRPDVRQAQLPRPNQNQRASLQKRRRTKRAGIRIASLNIKGFGGRESLGQAGKWHHVNQIMREKKIAVLAVQEAHMDEERQNEVEHLFKARLVIRASPNPNTPRGKEGVAIVINKELIDPDNAEFSVVIPGRAMQVKITQRRGAKINILTVYAPNNPSENADFWDKLRERYENQPASRTPDIILGDFNMVEDAIDRLPSHDDKARQVNALDDLKSELNIIDGWRDTFPTSPKFTFHQPNSSRHSRIDRIYLTRPLHETAQDWDILPSGIPNVDHDMVWTTIVDCDAPEIGKGRWYFPKYLTEDTIFMSRVKILGLEALEELASIQERTEEHNPQRVWNKFKREVLSFARKREKQLVPKLVSKRREIEQKIDNLMKDTTQDLDDATRAEDLGKLRQELRGVVTKLHMKSRKMTDMKWRSEEEIMTKSFAAQGKEKRPRDIIYALKTNTCSPTGEAQYERNSKRMTEIAKAHHESIQAVGEELQTQIELRECAIQEAIENAETQADPALTEALGANMTLSEMNYALRNAKNGSAAGIDGATYELWKAIEKMNDADTKAGQTAFSAMNLLTTAILDMEKNGIDQSIEFTDGWMCPIYKKNDRNEIGNYRPITLLNTDYKIYTKALSLRLAKTAPSLIHPAQAGFIPGRQISDQTQLIRMVMEYAEVTEENGMIVALDQEKAYDKIAHDYLWRIMNGFGIPEAFINNVKNLYNHAETKVYINGFFSEKFRVTRGVRQGDPLSCLLFNIAIEPLAIALRKSSLKGIHIPGELERLIEMMFADDTTVFLNKDDKWSDLEKVLDRWCIASRAQFNKTKTEVIPIGRQQQREELEKSRTIDGHPTEIPNHVRIVPTGASVRILGAWFGNKCDESAPWVAALSKMDSAVARWTNATVTTLGRRHVIQTTFGGFTQYLSQVQGMPPRIEKMVEKRLRAYLWNEKMSKVNMETALAPIDAGGLKVLDIRARNEAINLTWVKRYLNLSNSRPLWAKVMDAILASNTPNSEKDIPMEIRANVFLQSWKTYRGKGKRMAPTIRRILDTAKKYHVRLEGIKFSNQVVSTMPIWLHIKADETMARRLARSPMAKCLIENHQIKTVRDAITLAEWSEKYNNEEHFDSKECECDTCMDMENTVGCMSPSLCVRLAQLLIGTLPTKWIPSETETSLEDQVINPTVTNEKEALKELEENEEEEDQSDNLQKENWVRFERSLITAESTTDAFRVFTEGSENNEAPQPSLPLIERELIIVGTDGSCINNGEDCARAGAGVFVGTDSEYNRAIKVPQSVPQTNQTGELLAVAEVGKSLPKSADIFIEIDSTYAKNAATTLRQKMEDNGYIGTANREVIEHMIANLRSRTGATLFKWVKGHTGVHRNEGADHMAAMGANQAEGEAKLPITPPPLRLTGARLSKLTQKLAYRAIRERKMRKYNARTRTISNLERVQLEIEDDFDRHVTVGAIWKSLRHKDFTKETHTFLWKVTHDAYMVGNKWMRPNFSEEIQKRAECKECGTEDSMEHILTQCAIPGQEEIWELTKQIWEKRGYEWIKPGLGLIIGCGLVKLPDQTSSDINEQAKKTPKKASERLYRILISEAARAIWAIRCRRVIDPTTPEVTQGVAESQWRARINRRIELDIAMTNKKRYKKRAIEPSTVQATWRGLIEYESEYDWIKLGGVLVGTQPRPNDVREDELDGEEGERMVEEGDEEEAEGRRRRGNHDVDDEYG
jgi:exonuclease III/ribonuclease HI